MPGLVSRHQPGTMEDPTTSLLLSALAMTDPQLIHHMSMATGANNVAAQVKEEVHHMLEGDLAIEPDPGLLEVYSDEWPELLALIPVDENDVRPGSPIISWTPGLGRGGRNEMN